MSNFDNNPYAADSFTGNDGNNFLAPTQNIPDYLIPSILATICCCPPFGIVAIVFSAMASSEKSIGNYQKALAHSKNAKIFLLIGVIGGGLASALYIAMVILVAMAENM